MRFPVSAVVAALPALAAAQENPLAQYQAQFQNFLGNMGSYIPNPGRHDPVAALEAKTGAMKMHTLTLDNWKDTLYEPVAKDATEPVEWWVLTTGRNKTCFGHCGRAEQAFNETAAKFALQPNAPHMGMLNCDDQPILCNVWSAGVGSIWDFEMLPEPAAINIYKKRLNLTTVTTDEIIALQGKKDEFTLLDSVFHPFDGKIAELGLSVPLAYVIWFFNLVPSWATMLVISFFSRTMMSRRMEGTYGARPRQ
ncbi:hypothetical protein ACRE_004200 [Hapsidospora chrysogenum ATCC 11550]|uniref:Peptidyl-tRNA hydrolase-like protein n=1 Tax=Hapsidospora chrysogenum (strain ATCC 11550 / CBS 779.69 / DSM 880 / IAM 14645 / JCM 23072 / IMI 49137) TaxID=857340 RepID=A0A086THA4_HAPC1|nr:hypothetical protein ACRE_004200 [Hapsidospora chrysogenum ATCC 11550]